MLVHLFLRTLLSGDRVATQSFFGRIRSHLDTAAQRLPRAVVSLKRSNTFCEQESFKRSNFRNEILGPRELFQRQHSGPLAVFLPNHAGAGEEAVGMLFVVVASTSSIIHHFTELVHQNEVDACKAFARLANKKHHVL